jgi:hypothetical protein
MFSARDYEHRVHRVLYMTVVKPVVLIHVVDRFDYRTIAGAARERTRDACLPTR